MIVTITVSNTSIVTTLRSGADACTGIAISKLSRISKGRQACKKVKPDQT